MTTANKLEKALALIKEAAQLVSEARKNESLEEYYDVEYIERELNSLADNPKGYTGVVSIQEILDEANDKWTNEEPT